MMTMNNTETPRWTRRQDQSWQMMQGRHTAVVGPYRTLDVGHMQWVEIGYYWQVQLASGKVRAQGRADTEDAAMTMAEDRFNRPMFHLVGARG